MTTCTVCAAPCQGTDDDDNAWCVACWDAYVAWSDARPLGPVHRPRARTWRMPWEGQARVDGLRVLILHGNEGREG